MKEIDKARKEYFEKLFSLNVNDKTEKKNGLTYLSWAWAWGTFKGLYPSATYTIIKDESGKPYFNDDKLGIMVYTTVTADDLTYEMWLPVMDGANNAMKVEPYSFKTKFGEKHVEAATMFDVNKTLMRCLTKNLAMFGMGLYLYAGEDLPAVIESDEIKEWKQLIGSKMTMEALKEFYMTNKDVVEGNPEIKAIFTTQKKYIASNANAAAVAASMNRK